MEKLGSVVEYQALVLAELAHALELARQMEAETKQHLSNDQPCNLLMQELLVSIERSICWAKSSSTPDCKQDGDSPRSFSESFPADTCKLPFKDKMPKKRKTLPKWTKEVRVQSSAGIEVPIDDGYTWRKYGQKDILGAKHPRGYYRCTHRNTQNCLATKQVQRSDKDQLLFRVTYHGAHTCLQRRQAPTGLAQEQQQEIKFQVHENSQDLLLSFQTGLGVKTEELEFGSAQAAQTAVPFFLASPSTPENNCASSRPSPTFVSSTASDSTYFSVLSPSSFDGGVTLRNPEPCADGGANSTSTSSNFADWDLMLLDLDFDQDLSSFLK
ncbi:hypothetical protein Cni_G11894 [Canna indica]|uniref:WRKY domain-containing protein n=1 Tax=Canna indica TaxID=4628 RepID=A0AAQ3K7G1_9LILI|nr:hypothetical protein Cni_G11894 [Canna indica]